MSERRATGKFIGATCIAIGGVQVIGGVRAEPGMDGDATVDSHVRFMGSVFVAYGLGWLEAACATEPRLDRMRLLAGLMAVGGASRLITRATLGRPHRFHDFLLATELAAPIFVEAAARLGSLSEWAPRRASGRR